MRSILTRNFLYPLKQADFQPISMCFGRKDQPRKSVVLKPWTNKYLLHTNHPYACICLIPQSSVGHIILLLQVQFFNAIITSTLEQPKLNIIILSASNAFDILTDTGKVYMEKFVYCKEPYSFKHFDFLQLQCLHDSPSSFCNLRLKKDSQKSPSIE